MPLLTKFLSLAMLLVMVASCASLKRTFNRSSSDELSTDNFHGYYKVGAPYEIDGKWYYPKEQPDYDAYGIASWYGPDFHGKVTANGDTFDQNALTAAHNTLPLPSMVRVTNLENKKTLIVMVNDRGPFSKGRIIDLSKRSAEILGFKHKGTARVRVQYLEGHTRRLLADLPKTDQDQLTPVDLAARRNIAEDFPAISKNYDSSEKFGATVPVPQSTSVSAKPPVPTSHVFKHNMDALTNDQYATNDLPPLDEETVNQELQTATKRMDSTNVPPTKDRVAKNHDSTIVLSAAQESQPIAVNVPAEKVVIQKPVEKTHFIQAGTYGMKSNAKRVEDSLSPLGSVMINPITFDGRTLYQVRLGPIEDQQMATMALKKVIRLGHADAMLIKD